MTTPSYSIAPAVAADFPRLAFLETAGDAQFPPGRFPGEPGSDNVVEPALQRRGIGTSFLERALVVAAERGCAAVTLTTFADIQWNAPYYRKRGFRAMEPRELTTELRGDLEAERSAGMRERIGMVRFV